MFVDTDLLYAARACHTNNKLICRSSSPIAVDYARYGGDTQ